jgi:hypothetical protein
MGKNEQKLIEVMKETVDLVDAIRRLCAEADYSESVLSALITELRAQAHAVKQDPCCVLYEMFKMYTHTIGDIEGVHPDELFGKLLKHLTSDGMIRVEVRDR